jgi:DNA polymerase
MGVKLETLTAKSVGDTLKKKDLPPLAREILEIRRDAAKTSVKKYPALKERIGEGTRMRDYLLYHGASTGRWTGRGFQPQNLPRPSMKAKIVEQAIGTIKENNLEMLRTFYGNPMEALSSALRGCLISSKDKAFFCGDYASIEVRVLFWLSGHAEGLDAYKEKRDLYREMASKIYNVKLENVTKDQREIGKRAILGSGYQMSHKKFKETCALFGVIVSEELAQKAVSSYRELHHPVPKFWAMTERCAMAATKNEGKAYTYGKCTWFKRDGFLWVRLPSGRKLAYKGPEIRYEPTPWEEKRPKLYHWCENPVSKKWECAGTYGGRLVENLTQAAARDFMAEAMLRLEENGFEVLLSVHDELLTEAPKDRALSDFENLMAEIPTWGAGCPIGVDAWTGERYRK